MKLVKQHVNIIKVTRVPLLKWLVILCTVPVKSLDTPTHSRAFLYIVLFVLHCRIIVKTSKSWNNTWNHVVTKKTVKQIQIYFRFFKVATLCLMTALHTLFILSTIFMRNAFSLELVPTYAEHLLAAFPSLCSPTHPKPSTLGWGRVIVEARSSDAALHHPHWSNSPYTAWRCVLDHCPVEKHMIVPLNWIFCMFTVAFNFQPPISGYGYMLNFFNWLCMMKAYCWSYKWRKHILKSMN
jgi:hypothetical protein